MSDNGNIIIELIRELREDSKETRENVAKNSERMEAMQETLKEIKEESKEHKEDWRKHMSRTNAVEKSNELLTISVQKLTDLHLDNQKRIEILEKDKETKVLEKKIKKNIKQTIKDNVGWVIAIATGLAGAISKWLELW